MNSLQPFQRPGQRIHEAFYPQGRNILFPSEEISDVANLVKNSQSISIMAIEKYCIENERKKEDIEAILNKHKIKITDGVLYSLSRQQRRNLEREYEGRPYGDVKLHSRLCYTPPN